MTQNDQSEELMQWIQDAMAQKELLMRKISVAKITNQQITEELEKVGRERQEEQVKLETLKRNLEDVSRAEMYAASLLDKKKQDLARKDALCHNLRKAIQAIPTGGNFVKMAEQQLGSFQSALNNSPWLEEKQKYHVELVRARYEMGKTWDEVEQCMAELATVKKQLEMHQNIPFTKFCVLLAGYHTKSENLRCLMEREMALNKKLEAMVLKMEQSGNEMFVEDAAQRDEGNNDGNGGEGGTEAEDDGDEPVVVAEFNNSRQHQEEEMGEEEQLGYVRRWQMEQRNEQQQPQDISGTGTNLMHDLSAFLNDANYNNDMNMDDGQQGGEGGAEDNMPAGASVTQQNFMDFIGGVGTDTSVGGTADNNASFNLATILGGLTADTSGKAGGGTDFFNLFGDKSGENTKEDDFVIDFNFG